MKQLMLSSAAIALLFFPTLNPSAEAKPRVHCPKPLRNGQGLTATMVATIQAQAGQKTLGIEQLHNMALPGCIFGLQRSERGAEGQITEGWITFGYTDLKKTDRYYKVTVVGGFVQSFETVYVDAIGAGR